MTTYYVAANGDDGAAGTSEGAAWASPAKAVATSMSGGDVVRFRRGDTFSGVNSTVSDSGTDNSAPIRWSDYGQDSAPKPIFAQSGTSTPQLTLTGDYVHLENIRFIGGSSAILPTACTGFRVSNCEVKETNDPSILITGAGSGGVIEDSRIFSTNGDGISSTTHTGLQIRRNRIQRIAPFHFRAGEKTGIDAILLVDSNSQSDVHDNVVEGPFDYAVRCAQSSTGTIAQVYRNLLGGGTYAVMSSTGGGTQVTAISNVLMTDPLYALGAALATGSGFYVASGADLFAYNNTILNQSPGYVAASSIFLSASATATFTNNISQCVTSTGMHMAITSGASFTSDYNLFNENDSPLLGVGIAGRFFFGLQGYKFAGYKTASSQDANSLTGDALFRTDRPQTIPSKRLLSTSPALGAGTDLSGTFTYNALNETRSVPFNIGAL